MQKECGRRAGLDIGEKDLCPYQELNPDSTVV